MNTKVQYLTIQKEQFNALLAGRTTLPFLVVFTADWLGEGTIMDAIVEQLANEYAGRFGFFRIDIDVSDDLARQLGIRHYPTILFFQNGEMLHRLRGMKSKTILRQKIDELIRG